jgi:hypothetical protein
MSESADQGSISQEPPAAPAPRPAADIRKIRADLAASLEEMAKELDLECEELSTSWSPDNQPDLLNFWHLSLAKVKYRIDMIEISAKQCRKITSDDAGQGQKNALKDLDAALSEARIYTQAALRAIQILDDASQSLEQSRLHMNAVGQLANLASSCRALLPHLRGV